jgi:hypothetical protein
MDLIQPAPGQRVLNIYSPKFSPEGDRILFSYFDGKNRKLGCVGADGKNFRVVEGEGSDNRDGIWLTGKKGEAEIVFASDRTGIYNLYRKNLKTGEVKALTRVLGGAFTPEVVWKGDSLSLFYIGYDKDGFSLYRLDDLKGVDEVVLAHPSKNKEVRNLGVQVLDGNIRDYSPIPRVVTAVPFIAVEENAGSTRADAEGEAHWMGGAAVGVMDPLRKNFIQMSLALELGKGFDYVGTDGIEPHLHSEMMLMWENRSFPITLSAAGFRKNVTGKDTIYYEDPRSQDADFAINPYAVSFSGLMFSAGYSPFKKGDSVAVTGTLSSSAFNLYKDNFEWDFHKRQGVSAQFSFIRGPKPWQRNPSGKGKGLLLGYGYNSDQLFRPGTFFESFRVENGRITPIYRDFRVQEAMLAGWYGRGLPGGLSISTSFQASGIVDWEQKGESADTLDHFYHHRLDLSGYPVLSGDGEDVLIHGEKTLMLQAHLLYPLYKELGWTWWVFDMQDMYFDLFAQAGRAWDDSFFNEEWEEDWQTSFRRSVGVEFRMSNRIFYTQSFDVYFRFARALDKVRMADGEVWESKNLDIPLIPGVISPTEVQIGIGISLPHPALGLKQNPMNKMAN